MLIASLAAAYPYPNLDRWSDPSYVEHVYGSTSWQRTVFKIRDTAEWTVNKLIFIANRSFIAFGVLTCTGLGTVGVIVKILKAPVLLSSIAHPLFNTALIVWMIGSICFLLSGFVYYLFELACRQIARYKENAPPYEQFLGEKIERLLREHQLDQAVKTLSCLQTYCTIYGVAMPVSLENIDERLSRAYVQIAEFGKAFDLLPSGRNDVAVRTQLLQATITSCTATQTTMNSIPLIDDVKNLVYSYWLDISDSRCVVLEADHTNKLLRVQNIATALLKVWKLQDFTYLRQPFAPIIRDPADYDAHLQQQLLANVAPQAHQVLLDNWNRSQESLAILKEEPSATIRALVMHLWRHPIVSRHLALEATKLESSSQEVLNTVQEFGAQIRNIKETYNRFIGWFRGSSR